MGLVNTLHYLAQNKNIDSSASSIVSIWKSSEVQEAVKAFEEFRDNLEDLVEECQKLVPAKPTSTRGRRRR
jgi:hypothetical protein